MFAGSKRLQKYKVIEADGSIQYRVWMHRKTGQLGIGLPGTWLGDIWFFKDCAPDQAVSGDVAVFLDDKRDENSFSSDLIEDLGAL